MSIFDALNLIGGLAIFLFGMNIMSGALERHAGHKLRNVIDLMTSSKLAGFFTGVGITAIIQSTATSVMVVGFVNSGLLTLKQAINVIMGANVGTTITAWILSLSGISSSNIVVQLLKPQSFTPILAMIGTIFYLFTRKGKRKDTGLILIGFSLLMFGMTTMSGSVAGLRDVPEFQRLFLLFKNPILGVIAGAVLTIIIQSSAASVGVLQALSQTGQVSYAAAIPIIMGQNIGTCLTAIVSSTGTSKNAKRTAAVHLSFNIIGAIIGLVIFYVCRRILLIGVFDKSATMLGIATAHSAFNILCTVVLFPATDLLEKLVIRLIPDDKNNDKYKLKDSIILDKRLYSSPVLALERGRLAVIDMANLAISGLYDSLSLIKNFDNNVARLIEEKEDRVDKYEDKITSFLVQLGALDALAREESMELSSLLKLVGEFERISDHSVNIKESVEELKDKNLKFSDVGMSEITNFSDALTEVLNLSYSAFADDDLDKALLVEPLEEVIDDLKDELRTNHIIRMRAGKCNEETGYIWNDLLTDFERVSDHCSNIAANVIAKKQHKLKIHKMVDIKLKNDESFEKNYEMFSRKYKLSE